MLFLPIIPTITLLAQMILEYSTLTKRRTLSVHILVRGASLLFVYGGFWILNLMGVKSYFVYYLLTVAYVFSCLYLFSESFAQKMFFYFANWGITTFFSSVCYWIASQLGSGSEKDIIIRYVLYFVCYLVVIPLYLKYCRDRIKKILSMLENGNTIYAIYPILTFVLFCILFGPTTKIISVTWFVTMVIFEAIILFSYYLLFSQVYAVYWRMEAETRLNNTERLVLLQKKYYEQVDRGICKQRELMHDTRHNLVAMASFVKAREYDALEQHIQQLLEHYDSLYTRRFCENTTANAIIGGYIEIAEKKGISVSVEIDLPQEIGINKYELCTIFGNTIENAIEACQRISASTELYSKRYINIKSKVEKDRLIIRLENMCENSSKKRKGTLLSSKGSLGGVGLASVKNVVERYNGCLSCNQDANLFVVSIVMCLSPLKDNDG